MTSAKEYVKREGILKEKGVYRSQSKGLYAMVNLKLSRLVKDQESSVGKTSTRGVYLRFKDPATKREAMEELKKQEERKKQEGTESAAA